MKRIRNILCKLGLHFPTYWVGMTTVECGNCKEQWFDNPYMYT